MYEPTRIRNGFCFGFFIFDADTGELYRHQELYKRLRPQEHKVLAAMLDRYPAVIKRQELVTLLWGQGHEPDGGLKKVIGWLRENLGDSADDPQFIEVLPRVGVRFIARVEKLQAVAASATLIRQTNKVVVSSPLPAGSIIRATSHGRIDGVPKQDLRPEDLEPSGSIDLSRKSELYRLGWVHGFYSVLDERRSTIADHENCLYAAGHQDGISIRGRTIAESAQHGHDSVAVSGPDQTASIAAGSGNTCSECGAAVQLDDDDHRAYHCSHCGAFKQWSD